MKTEKRPFHFLGWSLTGWIGTAALLAAEAVTRSDRDRGRKVMNDSTTGLTSSERVGSAVLSRAVPRRDDGPRSAAPARARDRDRVPCGPPVQAAPPPPSSSWAWLLLGAAAAEAQTARVTFVSNVKGKRAMTAPTPVATTMRSCSTRVPTRVVTRSPGVVVNSDDAEGDDFDVEICEEDGTANEFPSTIASNCTALTPPAQLRGRGRWVSRTPASPFRRTPTT